MTHEQMQLGVIVGLAAIVLLGLAWSVLREMHWARVDRESRSTDTDVVDSIRDVHSALVKLCERLEAKTAAAQGNQEELRRLIVECRQLTLDVERRLHDNIRDNREFCRQHVQPATHIFNSMADGGQTNQGQTVEGNNK